MRERIEESDEISDADRTVLMDFSDELYLLQSKYSDHRHLNLLSHCTNMAEKTGGLADALKKEAAENLVRWINRTYDNVETNRDFRVALRVFGRRVTDRDAPPESIDWVPSGTPRNYDPAPSPGDMLRWEEDVLPMSEATRYSRDAALITTAWDSGARSGEIRSLTIGDGTDYQHEYQFTFHGKTERAVSSLYPEWIGRPSDILLGSVRLFNSGIFPLNPSQYIRPSGGEPRLSNQRDGVRQPRARRSPLEAHRSSSVRWPPRRLRAT